MENVDREKRTAGSIILMSEMRKAMSNYGASIASEKYAVGRSDTAKLAAKIEAENAFIEGAVWAIEFFEKRCDWFVK